MSFEPPAVVWVPGEGSAETLAGAAEAAGRADLVVVLPGIELFDDWLERLTSAARSDTVIATASALLSRGPWAPSPLPAGGLERTAATVAEHACRLRPRVSEPHAGAVLLRRRALDIAGVTDDDMSPAAALADFGERCTALGLSHVLAEDVLASGGPTLPEPPEAAALAARYPHRAAARGLDKRAESPIEHAVLVASRGLDKLSVTLDARALGPARAGTQVHALELIAALGRTGRVRLRIVTPPDLDPQARAALEQIDDLTLLPYETAAAQPAAPTDIVHRPSQVFSMADLALLLPLGRRLVVTHQDLIQYRIPTYHESVENWQRYRRVTQHTLGAADHVVFFSEHARADALADDLVDPAITSVVPIGVDHHVLGGAHHAPSSPRELAEEQAPFLLCLGADLPHKNHAFAIRLTAALRADHGWEGRLVFAGATDGIGARTAREHKREDVVWLGPVSEPQKAWLLEHAAAVVYPTIYEGFGLVPFEAAAAGTPCLFAAQTALAEMLPASTATLVAWDAGASARAVAPLLRTGAARSAHVAALRSTAADYRWDDTAQALVGLYEQVLLARPREIRQAPRERLALDQRLAETEFERQQEWQRYERFREQIGSDGLALVGPGGVLGPADQRALLALLSRSALRRPALRAAHSLYQLALRLQRRR
ncbi:MAG: glycosyltransferase [Solirubrobacteraceae bacterium]